MDLCLTPAVELARMLRARKLSARELLAAFLDRIDRINPEINAIVTLAPERALAAAAAADDAAAAGEGLGPLHGLPIAIKDLAETAGLRTTFGSPIFAENVPERDTAYVANLRRAGAIVLGKTNTPEFGAGSQTFNPVFGATRNPYDRGLTPGGSSGGAAAAVTAGLLPFADGSDLAASVRNPAAFCNLVGLRTTPGLVPGDPFDPLSVIGPIARSPADAALLLAGLSGQDADLPLSRPDRPSDFLDLRPADPRGLRVAWSPDLGDLAVDPAVTAVLDQARGALEDLGCEVTEAAPELSDADEVFQVLRAQRMAALGPLLPDSRDQMKQTLVWNIEKGLALTGADVAAALTRRAEIFQRMREFLGERQAEFGARRAGPRARETGFDVLALPTVQATPFSVDEEWVREINGVPQATYIDWMRSCSRITVTAHPAISVPAGFTPEGLPVGLQLVGRYGSDLGLLQIARAFTDATGHAATRPGL
jgi:amidase